MSAEATDLITGLISDTVDKYDADLVDLRRDLHAHPELSWSETRTSDLVAARVEQAGWSVTRAHRSGVVADLGVDGPAVALRADMDALPVQDLTEDPWRSQVTGVAHACGHDVHTAALVGAASGEAVAQGVIVTTLPLGFLPGSALMVASRPVGVTSTAAGSGTSR